MLAGPFPVSRSARSMLPSGICACGQGDVTSNAGDHNDSPRVDHVRGQHREANLARVYPLVDQVLDKEQFWPRVAQAEIGDSPSAGVRTTRRFRKASNGNEIRVTG